MYLFIFFFSKVDMKVCSLNGENSKCKKKKKSEIFLFYRK